MAEWEKMAWMDAFSRLCEILERILLCRADGDEGEQEQGRHDKGYDAPYVVVVAVAVVVVVVVVVVAVVKQRKFEQVQDSPSVVSIVVVAAVVVVDAAVVVVDAAVVVTAAVVAVVALVFALEKAVCVVVIVEQGQAYQVTLHTQASFAQGC